MSMRASRTISERPAIQSLAKGLRTLQLLAKEADAGFAQLQRASGLSKAALARVLQTLEHEGWITKRMADGHYQLRLGGLPADPAALAVGQLAELAAAPLRDMHAQTVWPSDISICTGAHMQILESNRAISPLTINRQVMALQAPSMLWSAVGRAYLAACPAPEREKIFKRLAQSQAQEDQRIHDRPWVDALLAQTRAQGYGRRDAAYPSPDQVFHGQLGAIAAPIMAGRQVLACLNLVWILSMASEDMIVQRYLGLLRKTAGAIGAAYAHHGITRPLWLDPRYSAGFAQAVAP